MARSRAFSAKAAAIVVHPTLRRASRARPLPSASGERERAPLLPPAHALAEAERLTAAGGWRVAGGRVIALEKERQKWFLGPGHVERARADVAAAAADGARDAACALVVNARLSGVQARNLRDATRSRAVLDRVGVILELFAARARSAEARAQVALAACAYERSRLVQGARAGEASWTAGGPRRYVTAMTRHHQVNCMRPH